MQNFKLKKEFILKAYGALSEITNPESEYYIDIESISENANEFTLVYACVAPMILYKNLTGEDIDLLGFNHIVNRLIIQGLRSKFDQEKVEKLIDESRDFLIGFQTDTLIKGDDDKLYNALKLVLSAEKEGKDA